MKKEKRGFSLPKRLIALFLAVAMVLGVLYFGNRKERTATADESVPDGEAFTDDDYFSGLIGGIICGVIGACLLIFIVRLIKK